MNRSPEAKGNVGICVDVTSGSGGTMPENLPTDHKNAVLLPQPLRLNLIYGAPSVESILFGFLITEGENARVFATRSLRPSRCGVMVIDEKSLKFDRASRRLPHRGFVHATTRLPVDDPVS